MPVRNPYKRYTKANKTQYRVRSPLVDKTKKESRKISQVIRLVIVMLCIVSASSLIYYYVNSRLAKREYQHYQQLVEQASVMPALSLSTTSPVVPPTKSPAHKVSHITTAATQIPYINQTMSQLYSTNSDTVGWLNVAQTAINYPIVRTDDNQFYLNHTFEKRKNIGGAIFMDYRNTGWDDFIAVLYGHNMKDGSMLHDIQSFRTNSFYKQHRQITVTGLFEEWSYRVFSVFHCREDFDIAAYNNLSSEKRQDLLQYAFKHSLVDKSLTDWPQINQSFLAIVTCDTGNEDTYTVILAVRE